MENWFSGRANFLILPQVLQKWSKITQKQSSCFISDTVCILKKLMLPLKIVSFALRKYLQQYQKVDQTVNRDYLLFVRSGTINLKHVCDVFYVRPKEVKTYKWHKPREVGLRPSVDRIRAKKVEGCNWQRLERWWRFRLAWSRSRPSWMQQ